MLLNQGAEQALGPSLHLRRPRASRRVEPSRAWRLVRWHQKPRESGVCPAAAARHSLTQRRGDREGEAPGGLDSCWASAHFFLRLFSSKSFPVILGLCMSFRSYDAFEQLMLHSNLTQNAASFLGSCGWGVFSQVNPPGRPLLAVLDPLGLRLDADSHVLLHFSERQALEPVCVALGDQQTLWALDIHGTLWFRTGIVPKKPQGEDDHWWQVGVPVGPGLPGVGLLPPCSPSLCPKEGGGG